MREEQESSARLRLTLREQLLQRGQFPVQRVYILHLGFELRTHKSRDSMRYHTDTPGVPQEATVCIELRSIASSGADRVESSVPPDPWP